MSSASLVDFFTNSLSQSVVESLSNIFGQDSFFGVVDTVTNNFVLPTILLAPLLVIIGLSITYLFIGGK